jgi:hypothetical protein
MSIQPTPTPELNAQEVLDQDTPVLDQTTEDVALPLIEAMALWTTPVKDSYEPSTYLIKVNIEDKPQSPFHLLRSKKEPQRSTSFKSTFTHSAPVNRWEGLSTKPSPSFCKSKEKISSQTLNTASKQVSENDLLPQRQINELSSGQQRLISQNRAKPNHFSKHPTVLLKSGRKITYLSKQEPSFTKEPRAFIDSPTHSPFSWPQKTDDQSRQSFSGFESASDNNPAFEATCSKINRLVQPLFQASKSINGSELENYLNEEAKELSAMLGEKVSHFDVLMLFIELMKLEIEAQDGDRIARRQERAAQLAYLEKEVKNLKTQSKWQLFSHIGSGIMGLISGASPIVGHMKGEAIIGGLSRVFTSLQGIRKKDFFDGIGKMAGAMSESQKAMSQIQGTSAEGERTRFNKLGDLHRSDQEESTRSIEQLQERIRQGERFLIELLQMRHDVTSMLYR